MSLYDTPQSTVGVRDESAAPKGGSGFASYTIVSRHCHRIYQERSYCEALDLLSEMSQTLGKIGYFEADFPDYPMLVKSFDKIKITVW